MSEKKPKRKVERRAVAKVINVQPPRPADDLFNPFAEAKAAERATPVTPVTDVTPVTPVTRVTQDAAPKRDFTRTANSIVREAVPAGVFTGKGKQLYDYLYSQTRGAVVPKMTARIPSETVMKGAGMTRHPFRAHLARLVSFGLVGVRERPGKHGGNDYTVYLPEEADPGHRGDRGHTGHTGDKVPPSQGSQPYPGDRGVSPDFQRTSGESKTLIQDLERTDDEAAPAASTTSTGENDAFSGLLALLSKVSTEITGKSPSVVDHDRWAEVGEVLVTELKIAAGRTTVSSVPAFLAEHLRRRLWKREKRDIDREAAETSPEGQGAQKTAIPEGVTCPDCFNTGMFYPEGFDKGVARCTHARLAQG